MKTRLRSSMEEREGGFTLIELLVVIIIIGILAAIAIPVFLNQRKKAVDASMKSDARTVANEEETYYTDFQSYKPFGPSTATATVGADVVTLSPGNAVTVTLNTAGLAYCIMATNLKSTTDSASAGVVYISSKGGLQPSATTVCPGAGAF